MYTNINFGSSGLLQLQADVTSTPCISTTAFVQTATEAEVKFATPTSQASTIISGAKVVATAAAPFLFPCMLMYNN